MLIPQKISERATASAITGAEIIPLVQGGDDCIVTAAVLLAWGNITGKESVWTSANSNLSTVDWAANKFVAHGDVGIGTTEPGYKLDVAGTLGTNGTATFGDNSSGGSGRIILNALGTTGNMPNITLKSGGTQYGVMCLTGAILGTNATDVGIFAETGKTINLWPGGGTTGMIINTSGNVGIGFTAPLSKCAINGGLHVGGDSDAGDNNLLVDGTITGNGGLQTFGANDSAGTGYRTVRVPNI